MKRRKKAAMPRTAKRARTSKTTKKGKMPAVIIALAPKSNGTGKGKDTDGGAALLGRPTGPRRKSIPQPSADGKPRKREREMPSLPRAAGSMERGSRSDKAGKTRRKLASVTF